MIYFQAYVIENPQTFYLKMQGINFSTMIHWSSKGIFNFWHFEETFFSFKRQFKKICNRFQNCWFWKFKTIPGGMMVKMVIIGNMYVIMPLAVLSLIQSLLSNFLLLFLNCCCAESLFFGCCWCRRRFIKRAIYLC